MGECQWRITSVCSGIPPEDGFLFDMGDVLQKYDGARLIYDINQTGNLWNWGTVQAMRLVARDFGFKSMVLLPPNVYYGFIIYVALIICFLL